MRRALRIALVVIICVAALVSIWAASAPRDDASGDVSQEAAKTEAAEEAAPKSTLSVTANGEVPAYDDDPDGFTEELATYLKASGIDAVSATVTQPSLQGPPYVLVAGRWLECRRTGESWAFAILDGVPDAIAGEPTSPLAEEQEDPDDEASAINDEEGEGAEWVPLDEAGSVIGYDAAENLDAALAGWAAAKGIGYTRGSVEIDAGSTRAETDGVGFVAAASGHQIDVIFTSRGYGFLLLE